MRFCSFSWPVFFQERFHLRGGDADPTGGESGGVRAAALLGGVYSPNPFEGRALSGLPAFLVIHGGKDTEVPVASAEKLTRVLSGARGSAELQVSRESIHAVENWRPSELMACEERLAGWLSSKLGLLSPSFEGHATRLQKNVVYGSYDEFRGKATSLYLDAWIPAGEGPFPAVIVVHGGGWEAGDKVTYIAPMLEPLARAGFAWFSIDYRLTPRHRHEDQLADLRRAIQFVRHEASRFHIDPTRIALLGESASGQMVALVGAEDGAGDPRAKDPVDRESSAVKAIVSFYGVYDFSSLVKDASKGSLLGRLFGLTSMDDAARDALKQNSPLHRARAGQPPVLLICGTKDSLLEQALAYEKRLKGLGIRHDFLRLEGAAHGMESWEGHAEWMGYKTRVTEWLKGELIK